MQKNNTKSRASEIANTFEWLITAFILALIVRGFVIEAFRIPTGSMASTLRGDHFRLRCRQCGYRYDFGVDSTPQGPGRFRPQLTSRCPSCGYMQDPDPELSLVNGDRILVARWFYNFFEPQRWDVVVFKYPVEPQTNYIKRMVAGPGETLEFIDGNVFIDGRIARKPHKVQSELWMPIFNNDYQPIEPGSPRFNAQTWSQPFKNQDQSSWQAPVPGKPTHFRLDASDQQVHTLYYEAVEANGFRATYAYNAPQNYRHQPFSSDLMIRFHVTRPAGPGLIGATLTKYGVDFTAVVDYDRGLVRLESDDGSGPAELAQLQLEAEPQSPSRSELFQFSNADQMLIVKYGDQQLYHDLGTAPDVFDLDEDLAEPAVRILGAGTVELSHIGLYRDIFYKSRQMGDGRVARGGQGNPITLGQGEFFMVGDNSSSSDDSRWWAMPGKGNLGQQYEPGIVPREYILGKALFIYWPSGFSPWPGGRINFVPDLGRTKFIYGAGDDSPRVALPPAQD